MPLVSINSTSEEVVGTSVGSDKRISGLFPLIRLPKKLLGAAGLFLPTGSWLVFPLIRLPKKLLGHGLGSDG